MEEIKACMNDILDKVCQREWSRRYYQKNKEKVKKRARAWNKNNLEKVRVYGKKYDKSIKGRKRARKANKNYYNKNVEKYAEYYEKNKHRWDRQEQYKKYRDSGRLKAWSKAYDLKYA